MRGEFIDLGGERIYYYAAGTRGDGDPIVLIHGFPTSSHLWTDVVAKLPAGHRILVVDLLGFGRSDAPAGADYSIAGHADRIFRLLDALRIGECLLVGHDVGSAVAVFAALQKPDCVRGVAMIEFDTTDRRFSGFHSIARAARALVLKLPVNWWMPFARRTIARRYSDPDRGLRSARIYLMPFTTAAGAIVLKRHVKTLTQSRIVDMGRRISELHVPVTTLAPMSHRCAPEESPSEVAATVAKLVRGSSGTGN